MTANFETFTINKMDNTNLYKTNKKSFLTRTLSFVRSKSIKHDIQRQHEGEDLLFDELNKVTLPSFDIDDYLPICNQDKMNELIKEIDQMILENRRLTFGYILKSNKFKRNVEENENENIYDFKFYNHMKLPSFNKTELPIDLIKRPQLKSLYENINDRFYKNIY